MHEILIDIVRSGVLAPSADNQHIFQVELGASFIRLWPTQAFSENTARLQRVLGLISLGAVVENMRLRATELGLIGDVIWSTAGEVTPLAQLNLKLSITTTSDILATAMPARCTNRRMYHGPGLTQDETAQLNAAVATANGVKLIWLTGAARKRALKLIWLAESERFLRKTLHEDIFSSIRFDLSWHETSESGLPPGSLEIEAPMRPMFKALRHWSLMRPLTWLGIHRLLGLRAGWLPAWQAPALGIFATSLPMEQGSVAVGAALERLWLRATLLDLAMQPMAASVVLMQHSDAAYGASNALQTTLELGWQTITPGLNPLMVFRIGHAGKPTVRSKRKPINDYLLTSKREADYQ